MDIAEKLVKIAENEQKVYDAGKKAEYDAFWDAYQNKGKRTNYSYAFYGYNQTSNPWNDVTFKPKYNMKLSARTNYMFYMAKITNLKQILEDLGVEFSLVSGCDNVSRMFAYSDITHVPKLVVPSTVTNFSEVFYASYDLVEAEFEFSEKTKYTAAFLSCEKLQKLIITGTIGQNGFDVAGSPKLTEESLLSILNALKDYSSSTSSWVCTLGTTNLEKLTDEQKAIATEKGWTLA